jgi:hypothetical protein
VRAYSTVGLRCAGCGQPMGESSIIACGPANCGTYCSFECVHAARSDRTDPFGARPLSMQAQDAELDDALLERRLAERPRDLTAYWRARTPWLWEARPPRVELPRRPFAEWEQGGLGRLNAGMDPGGPSQ